MTRAKPGRGELTGLAFRRPLSAELILVPAKVELRGQDLVWRIFDGDVKPTERFPGSGLLWEFVALADEAGDDEVILKFARDWGVLGVCRHRQPNYHPRYEQSAGRKALVWCVPRGGFGFKGREPLATWRKIAQDLGTLIQLAAKVAHGDPGDDEDWLRLDTAPETLRAWGSGLPPRRERLATWLNHQLILSNSRVSLRWSDPVPELRLVGHGLYAALIQQLVLEVSRAVDLFVCAECGKPDKGGRRYKRRRKFCDVCRGNGAPLRQAQRDCRDRKKARELSARGVDPRNIATELARPLAEVETWVGRKSRFRPIELSRPHPESSRPGRRRPIPS